MRIAAIDWVFNSTTRKKKIGKNRRRLLKIFRVIEQPKLFFGLGKCRPAIAFCLYAKNAAGGHIVYPGNAQLVYIFGNAGVVAKQRHGLPCIIALAYHCSKSGGQGMVQRLDAHYFMFLLAIGPGKKCSGSKSPPGGAAYKAVDRNFFGQDALRHHRGIAKTPVVEGAIKIGKRWAVPTAFGMAYEQ